MIVLEGFLGDCVSRNYLAGLLDPDIKLIQQDVHSDVKTTYNIYITSCRVMKSRRRSSSTFLEGAG